MALGKLVKLALHDELELFVASGFTPFEASQTATRNPAEFLGLMKDLGGCQTIFLRSLEIEALSMKNRFRTSYYYKLFVSLAISEDRDSDATQLLLLSSTIQQGIQARQRPIRKKIKRLNALTGSIPYVIGWIAGTAHRGA